MLFQSSLFVFITRHVTIINIYMYIEEYFDATVEATIISHPKNRMFDDAAGEWN